MVRVCFIEADVLKNVVPPDWRYSYNSVVNNNLLFSLTFYNCKNDNLLFSFICLLLILVLKLCLYSRNENLGKESKLKDCFSAVIIYRSTWPGVSTSTCTF